MTLTAEITLELSVAGRRLEAVELPGDPERRPLVLLHEGLGSVGLWREFPRALGEATGRRVIAYSRWGHGRSERPPATRTPAFFGEEAHVVLPEVLRRADAAFRGWCDVWLDPAFRNWSLERDAERV
jgi:pimeloyl-ACP methyl ester carboxylesterase